MSTFQLDIHFRSVRSHIFSAALPLVPAESFYARFILVLLDKAHTFMVSEKRSAPRCSQYDYSNHWYPSCYGYLRDANLRTSFCIVKQHKAFRGRCAVAINP
jgi:hypothetical protein